MKTYCIIKEGADWNIIYYDEAGKQETKEFWSNEGEGRPAEGIELRPGYVKRNDSL